MEVKRTSWANYGRYRRSYILLCIYCMTHPPVIYYDSEGDAACAIISTLIVMSHKDSSLMTN